MRAYLIIAFQNLIQARRRTLPLGLAIVLVTMLLIVHGALLGAGLAAGLDAAQVPLANTFLSSILLLSETLHVSATTGQLVKAVVLFTLITGLSAISPAIRAARLQPVNAIQHTS